MPKKSGVESEEIRKWMNRIKSSEKIRNNYSEKYGWNRAIKEYQNDFASAMPSFVTDVDLVPINEVYSFVKAFIPSVYSRDPYITVNPKGKKHISSSKMIELALNAYWRELRLKREVKRCILDAILAEAYMKVGYSAVFGSIEKKDGKSSLEVNEFIKDEEIFATRVSWKSIVKDTDAINGLHDARWMAHNIIRPLDAVRNSSIYENASDLKPSFVASDVSDVKLRSRLPGQDIEYVSLWEIWDRDGEGVYTLADGHYEYLMNRDWPYDMEGFPFVDLRFNENPDEPYSLNLIASWEPQLWEKIKLRSMQLDHVKRFNRQLAIEEGAMTRNEMEKFRLGKTGSIVQYKKGKQPPQSIPYPPVQTDIYAVEGRIDLDKDNVSGQPNAVRSAPQRTQSRTLGEIDRLISSFQFRQTEPQDLVEEFAEEISYKIVSIMQDHLPGNKFIRATQEDVADIIDAFTDQETGESRFDGTGFNLTKKDIRGAEFEIDIKAGSMIPLDRQNRIEVISTLLKVGQYLGLVPGGKTSRILGKNLFSEFDMKEVELAYEEELREMEAQKEVQREEVRLRQSALEDKISETRNKINSNSSGGIQDVLQGLR